MLMLPRPYMVYTATDPSHEAFFVVEMHYPLLGGGKYGKYVSGIVHPDGTFRPYNDHLTRKEFEASNAYE